MTRDLGSSLSSATDFLWDPWPLYSGRSLCASVFQSVQWNQGCDNSFFSCMLAVNSPSTHSLVAT